MRKGLMSRMLVVLAITALAIVTLAPAAYGDYVAPDWWRCKVIESGGYGSYPNSNFLCRGTQGYTPSYGSMANYQGKINSFYVSHVDINNILNQAEVGWGWLQPSTGYAPRLFTAMTRNNVQRITLLNQFTPGTTHKYAIAYRSPGPGNDYSNWGCWFDNQFIGDFGWTKLIDGWSTVGGERSTRMWFSYLGRYTVACSGNAEFDNVERYRTSDGWKLWTNSSDWNRMGPKWNLDTDTAYKFSPYWLGIGGGQIRLGNG